MTNPHEVERVVELDASQEDVWRCLIEPGQLALWLGDEVDVELAPGASGRVVEDGRTRHLEVDEVVPGDHLAFRWWDEDDGEAGASCVTITLLPSDGPTTLVVREAPLGLRAQASVERAEVRDRFPGLAWDVRLGCLAFLLAAVRV
jgi:uncharacterized protein YndB with AHSA1/START domain